MRSALLWIGAAAIAIGLSATPAYAATRSLTATTGSWSDGQSLFTWELDKLTDAEGTLNSVDIDLQGGVQGAVSFTNATSSPVTASVTTAMVLQAVDAANNTLWLAEVTPTAKFTFRRASGSGKASGGESMFASTENGADLSWFQGTGKVKLELKATKSATTAGATFAPVANTSQANITLTYNYTQVPEPATFVGLATLGITGIAVCFARKRRS